MQDRYFNCEASRKRSAWTLTVSLLSVIAACHPGD